MAIGTAHCRLLRSRPEGHQTGHCHRDSFRDDATGRPGHKHRPPAAHWEGGEAAWSVINQGKRREQEEKAKRNDMSQSTSADVWLWVIYSHDHLTCSGACQLHRLHRCADLRPPGHLPLAFWRLFGARQSSRRCDTLAHPPAIRTSTQTDGNERPSGFDTSV